MLHSHFLFKTEAFIPAAGQDVAWLSLVSTFYRNCSWTTESQFPGATCAQPQDGTEQSRSVPAVTTQNSGEASPNLGTLPAG